MKPLADDEIPPVIALGRQVAEQAAKAGEAPPPANPNRAAWVHALERADGKR